MPQLSVALALIGILFTALPFIRTDAWYIRILDFPRAQIAAICLIALGLLFYFTDWRTGYILPLLCGTFLAVAYQISRIMRFTPFYPKAAHRCKNPQPEHSLTLLQSNVRMENDNAEKFLRLVRRFSPDIVSVNEPGSWWAAQLKELEKDYPYRLQCPLDNTYGMMLFSRLPLKDTEINFLVEEGVPSFFAKVELPSGRTFHLHCVHPEPPHPGQDTDERDTELMMVGKRIQREGAPAIVVGDLNDVAWSHSSRKFQRVARVVDPRQGRGLFNTYNAFVPLFRYPLDHFFYTPHFGLIALKKGPAFGSDHYPMILKVCLERE